MAGKAEIPIRLASADDAPAFGRLLHAFNVEFDEPTPDADVIAARAAPLIESGEVVVLFVGEGPEGFAQLRFRPSLGTSEDDVAARALYESAGFTNREGSPDGPTMLYYERDL
jgi:hypothetical protein